MLKITFSIKHLLALLLYALILSICNAPSEAQSKGGVHNYVFFGLDRQKIRDASFLNAKALEGAQLKYTWRTLEPQKGIYDFNAIASDLAFLKAHGKTLFVQVQDTSFDPKVVNVPPYLVSDPSFHGGADKQYNINGDDEKDATPEGWVARRWDPAVRERFAKLLDALGKKFDGQVAGINLPETAVDFGETGKLWPKGFTPPVYRDAILAQMAALKGAFPKSVAMQYANFMPGEWLPWTNHHYLESVYARAKQLGVGIGGPDLLPYKRGQMSHDYKLIPGCAGIVPIGIAVQDGNYASNNPKTGKRVTIGELYDFATKTLKVNYIFWGDQEPYYTRDALPFLRGMRWEQSRRSQPYPGARNPIPALTILSRLAYARHPSLLRSLRSQGRVRVKLRPAPGIGLAMPVCLCRRQPSPSVGREEAMLCEPEGEDSSRGPKMNLFPPHAGTPHPAAKPTRQEAPVMNDFTQCDFLANDFTASHPAPKRQAIRGEAWQALRACLLGDIPNIFAIRYNSSIDNPLCAHTRKRR